MPSFKRRAPLINRGYWLRTRAIESKVESFLARGPGCKVVVNLGCGYDVLPFRMRSKGAGPSLFVDVDYPDLIDLKATIVAEERTVQGRFGKSMPFFQGTWTCGSRIRLVPHGGMRSRGSARP